MVTFEQWTAALQRHELSDKWTLTAMSQRVPYFDLSDEETSSLDPAQVQVMLFECNAQFHELQGRNPVDPLKGPWRVAAKVLPHEKIMALHHMYDEAGTLTLVDVAEAMLRDLSYRPETIELQATEEFAAQFLDPTVMYPKYAADPWSAAVVFGHYEMFPLNITLTRLDGESETSFLARGLFILKTLSNLAHAWTNASDPGLLEALVEDLGPAPQGQDEEEEA